MSKKAILTTFVTVIILVVIVGALSFLVAKNRPSADVAAPPVPPVPSGAPSGYPPVPPIFRLKGDANNDGIVNVLDLSVIISNWQQTDTVHNLVDDVNGKADFINALDLSQVITYWKCTELKSGCGYYTPTATPTGTAVVPPPVPSPPLPSNTAVSSLTPTATPSPTATATPEKSYVIKRGETKAIDGYPFSIMYYSGGVSGFYYIYIAAKNTSKLERCVSKFQTFSANKYSAAYICGSTQYTITLNPKKSNTNQITVSVVEKTTTATVTVTPKPTITATPVCRWYDRLRRRCF